MGSRVGMPTMGVIAAYWSEGWSDVCGLVTESFGSRFYGRFRGWGEPFCFACGWMPPVDDTQHPRNSWNDSAAWLERAHVVPVSRGGDNQPRNLIPLCHPCHKDLDRLILPGDLLGRAATLRWISVRSDCPSGSQRYTDFLYGEFDGNPQAALEWIESRSFHYRAMWWWAITDAIVKIEFGHDLIPHDKLFKEAFAA